MDIYKLIEECMSLCHNEDVTKKFNQIKLDLTVSRITASDAKTKMKTAIDDYAASIPGKPYWVTTVQNCIDKFTV